MSIQLPKNSIEFIPHEQPMVFVDVLTELGENFACAELQIRPELMFCDEQGLPTWASIELMAQTVSLFAGAKSQSVGKKTKIGFLLGTRKLNLPIAYFALGKTIKIRAEQQYLHEGLGQFSCQIEYGEYIISAMLSVYEPENISDISFKI